MKGERFYLHQQLRRRGGRSLRRIADKYSRNVRGVRMWFVEGPGEKLILWIIVAAAMTYALYIGYGEARNHYAREHNLPLAVLLFLLVSVFVAASSPLCILVAHEIAKHVAGIVGFVAMAICGLVMGCLIAPVFGVAIAVLFLWTLASALLFVPLRIGHSCWLFYRKIKYKCPYDDCRHTGLPIHVCACGAEYPDLEPNRYGIFHHTCHHRDGSVKLPTLFGRNRLPRRCGGCGRPLIHSSLGELREFPIFVIGGVNAGKSILLTQALRRLMEILGSRERAEVGFDSEEQQRDYNLQLELLNRGQVLAKTSAGSVPAVGLAVRIPKGLHALVYLFDRPGEYYQSMRQFGRMQGIDGLSGALLVVDPFSLRGLEEHSNAGCEPFHTIAGNLIHAVEQMLVSRPQQKCKVPLAVVLTKADALPVATYPFLDGLVGLDHESQTALSRGCREALCRLGAEDSVRLLEQKFANVQYFACSATGRMPDPRDRSPFRPVGVERPLLWLLGKAAGYETSTTKPAELARGVTA